MVLEALQKCMYSIKKEHQRSAFYALFLSLCLSLLVSCAIKDEAAIGQNEKEQSDQNEIRTEEHATAANIVAPNADEQNEHNEQDDQNVHNESPSVPQAVPGTLDETCINAIGLQLFTLGIDHDDLSCKILEEYCSDDLTCYGTNAFMDNDNIVVLRNETDGVCDLVYITTLGLWKDYGDIITDHYKQCEPSEYNDTHVWQADHLLPPVRYGKSENIDPSSYESCPEDIANFFFNAYDVLRLFTFNGLINDENAVTPTEMIGDNCYYEITDPSISSIDELKEYLMTWFTGSFIDSVFDAYPENIIARNDRLLGCYNGEIPGDATIRNITPIGFIRGSDETATLIVSAQRYTRGGIDINLFNEIFEFKMTHQNGRWVFVDLHIIGSVQ